jgi:hypothetical protein
MNVKRVFQQNVLPISDCSAKKKISRCVAGNGAKSITGQNAKSSLQNYPYGEIKLTLDYVCKHSAFVQ